VRELGPLNEATAEEDVAVKLPDTVPLRFNVPEAFVELSVICRATLNALLKWSGLPGVAALESWMPRMGMEAAALPSVIPVSCTDPVPAVSTGGTALVV
jgi:hypothetical protein